MPLYYTVDEVAGHLKISSRWASQLLRAGRLKGTQLGARGSWRVAEEDLKSFIRSRGSSQDPRTPVGEPIFVYAERDSKGIEITVHVQGRAYILKNVEQLTAFVHAVGVDSFARQAKDSGLLMPPMEISTPGPEKISEGLRKAFAKNPNGAPGRGITLLVFEEFPDVVADRIQRWEEEAGIHPAR